MRWYALMSLFSDGRVKFLLWFVAFAVVAAIVLTVIEIRLKKKEGEASCEGC